MSAESSPSPKKHRVMAWKPEGADIDPVGQRRYPRWVFFTATAFGILFVLLAVRTGYVLWEIERGRTAALSGPGQAGGGSLTQSFADRSQAEFARGEAVRAMAIVEKTSPDHPAIIQRIITINKLRDAADKAFGDRSFALAIQRFDAVTTEAKSFAEILEDRGQAREGYNKFIVNAARLERFKDLDPESFTGAITAAGAGQTFLDQGSFTLAREKIDEAVNTLLGIEKAIAVELEANLSIGRAALTHGDGTAATLAFTQALNLQPDNELAAKGLERAKSIDKVFGLLGTAAELETGGRLEDAQKSFEQAFALDGQSATAQAGIARIRSNIKKRDFQNALALAQTAREARKWDEVISSLQSALKVFPDDKDVKTQLAEARVLQRETRVQDMLASAYAFEREYNWEGAKRTYLELLAYEPRQLDAEEGLLRSGKVIRALLVFEKKIEEARSHAQRANFQLAISAFNEAMSSKPSYLELSPEQDQLKSILERQSKPVQITFISDKKTYVTINGVRMLNKFDRMTVPLAPGNYEVIGRRKGFEDVRESLRIRADDVLDPITIVAKKKM